jgi:hypothetical protein
MKRGLNAAEYCARLGEIIKRLGPKAYEHFGIIILYSGPNDEIKKLLEPLIGNNWSWPRSRDQAKRLGGVRLDDTFIGRSIAKKNLEKYFAAAYPGDPDAIRQAAFDVWAFISREFVKTAFKHASTVVCGADETRVFRAHELRIAIYNPFAETINNVPIAKIQDAYASGGEYAAFIKICQGELAMMRQWVRDAKPGAEKDAAWEDYRARRKFFHMERQDAIRGYIDPVHRAVSSLSAIHSSIAAMPSPPAIPPTSHPKIGSAGLH